MAFSWVDPTNWFLSRRHAIARFSWYTDRQRRAWVAHQRGRGVDPDFRLELDPALGASFSFLVVGDPGEGDASQFVVVDPFVEQGRSVDFGVIVSDVVYPSGRSADYREKFYVPYRHFPRDLYAVPGNHDWYDGLVGFMTHFCGTSPCDPSDQPPDPPTWCAEEKIAAMRHIRANGVAQPNMYFHIDHPQVRIVAIDAGFHGDLGDDQVAWLRRVSAVDKPKILLSGLPTVSMGRPKPAMRPVLDVLAGHDYRLMIGGDHHDFQAYRPLPGRVGAFDHDVWHVVSGGGGAYTKQVVVDDADLAVLGIDADDPTRFACHPPRAPERSGPAGLPPWLGRRLPDWLLDTNTAPYHKSFLRIDVDADAIRVESIAVDDYTTGTPPATPPVRPVWETVIPLR